MTSRLAQAVDKSEPVLHRIRAEYFEMPGLALTLSQAQRLWGLSCEECEVLLERLVAGRFLRRTHRGAFVKD